MGKIVKLKNANNVYTYPITKTEAVYIEDNKTTLKDYLNATAIIKTVGPAQMVTFNDGANNIPVKSCIINLEPYQEGTGDPSPSNIRPISGRTGMTVTRANKNLMPNMSGQASHTTAGIAWTYNDDGSFTLDGTATSNVYSRGVGGLNYKIYLPHGTYKKPVMQIDASHTVGLFVQYVRSASDWVNVTGGGFGSTTFTIDEDYPIVIRVAVQNGTTVDNVRFEPYVYPDSVSDLTWVSPVKTNYPISWQTQAGTIYGGTLDVVSGVLTVEYAKMTVTENSQIAASGSNYRVYDATIKGGIYLDDPNVICDIMPNSASGNYARFYVSGSPTNKNIYIANANMLDASIVDVASFKAWVADHNFNVVYPLATPTTYQLSPTEVKTLLGGNTIYTDAGDVSVEYVADTKMYIDNKIAELQALASES